MSDALSAVVSAWLRLFACSLRWLSPEGVRWISPHVCRDAAADGTAKVGVDGAAASGWLGLGLGLG